MSADTELPPATPKACDDCPWRRVSLAGWLGPFSAREWLDILHSDQPIACHQTIKTSGSWEGAKQCRGAAIMRENVRKLPRNPAVAVGPLDTATVFANGPEFLAHHDTAAAESYREKV